MDEERGRGSVPGGMEMWAFAVVCVGIPGGGNLRLDSTRMNRLAADLE